MTRMISLADVKPLLPIRSGNGSYDARILQIIQSVSSMIETECRQKFTAAERSELHTARSTINRTLNLYSEGEATGFSADEQIIALGASPIDPEASVTVWYDPLRKFTDDTIIDPEFYTVDAELSRILLRYPTQYVRSGFKVRYTAGFAVGDDGTLSEALAENAADLKQAAIYSALHIWNRTSPEMVGTEKDSDDKRDTRLNSMGLPRECLLLLAPYRRVLTGRG